MSTRRDSTTDKQQKNQYSLAFAEESRVQPRWPPWEGPNRCWRSARQKVRLPSQPQPIASEDRRKGQR